LLVRGGDHLGVADGAAGLDDGADVGVGEEVEAVAEGKEGVAGGHVVGDRQDRFRKIARDFLDREIEYLELMTL
jgi:hypothetical protein